MCRKPTPLPEQGVMGKSRSGVDGRHRLPMMLRALSVLAALWLASAAVVRVAYRGDALPGTTIAGVAVGGADAAEARRALARANLRHRAVVLVWDARRFSVTGADVGLRLDIDRSVERALAAGRGGVLDFIATPAAALGLRRADLQDDDLVSMSRVAHQGAAIARRVERPAFAGQISIDPASLKINVEPPRDGRTVSRRTVSRRTVARMIAHGLRGDEPGPLALPVRARRAPPVGDVRRVAAAARAYLADGSIVLTGGGRPITLSRRRTARILALERRSERGDEAVALGVDDHAVKRLVAEISHERDRPPRDARATAPATAVLFDAQGETRWRPRRASVRVSPGRPGRAILREDAARAIAAAVASRRHDVRLPVRTVDPTISTTAARRVSRLLGTFTTRFPCCQPRVQNIRLIARRIDGTIIAAGRQFSLNREAGARTRRRGFVPAPFIADGEIVDSVGGGVSQFSTTMYNAAYFAGLRIDAHRPHSFFIDRYPAGREATLDYGSIDLVWTNDTRAPVLVRASSTPTSVTVSLYGANGGRRVRAVTGTRQPVPGRDFAITVTRIIRYADGRVVRQPHTTTYDRPPANE